MTLSVISSWLRLGDERPERHLLGLTCGCLHKHYVTVLPHAHTHVHMQPSFLSITVMFWKKVKERRQRASLVVTDLYLRAENGLVLTICRNKQSLNSVRKKCYDDSFTNIQYLSVQITSKGIKSDVVNQNLQ